MKYFLSVALVLIASVGLADEPATKIVITGPSTTTTNTIQAGVLYKLPVSGIPAGELSKASVTVNPSVGVTAEFGKTLDDELVIYFLALNSGIHNVVVDYNKAHQFWRQELQRSYVDAQKAGASEEVLALIQSAIDKAIVDHPVQSGIIVLSVSGPRPPPPPIPPDQPIPPDAPDPPKPPVDPDQKVSRVTYVYEKDHGNVPRPVSFALQRLNATGIVATEFEEDTKTGNGETPEQYKIALASARGVGLPALVVQSGTRVLRVVKAPTTEQHVMDAVK